MNNWTQTIKNVMKVMKSKIDSLKNDLTNFYGKNYDATSITDFNLMISEGRYFIGGATEKKNAPSGISGGWGWLEVKICKKKEGEVDGYITQIFHGNYSTKERMSNDINGSSWGSWR